MELYCLTCRERVYVPDGAAWPTCACGGTRFTNDPDADEQFRALAEGLPVAWAQLSASDSGGDLAAAYIRAAYGRGYVAALEEQRSG